MKRILVSGASGVVGYGALRSLRQAGQACFLVGTSIYDDSVAPAFCDAFELAPPTGAPEYLEWLLDTLHRYRIDLLIPGIEVDMFHWLEHVVPIRATGALRRTLSCSAPFSRRSVPSAMPSSTSPRAAART